VTREEISALAREVAAELRNHPPVPRVAYTVAEAATALGVSPDFIDDRIKDRSLPCFKLGSLRMIRAEALHSLGEPKATRA
jgi:excisionase family DNA binding protein